MNCRTCQYELSQCLDGRLPSGRRAIVMQHVDGCGACAQFWRELQQAQEVVLQLARQRVSRDFRERLFERIGAGEGTPPAVFQEPVPLATKIRYLLSGAAAAAAVLVVATLLRNPGARTVDDAAVASAPSMVKAPSRLTPRAESFAADTASLASLPSFQPLTTDLVAVEAAKAFQNRYTWTSNNLDRLEQGNDDVAVRVFWKNTDVMRRSGKLLLALRRDRQVSFADAEVEKQLRLVVQSLDSERLQQPDRSALREVVPVFRDTQRLAEIMHQLEVRPALDPEGQQVLLQRLSFSMPDALEQLFEMVPMSDADITIRIDPTGRARVFNGSCGFLLAFPRNR